MQDREIREDGFDHPFFRAPLVLVGEVKYKAGTASLFGRSIACITRPRQPSGLSMRWSFDRVETILTLRGVFLDELWDDFWTFRA